MRLGEESITFVDSLLQAEVGHLLCAQGGHGIEARGAPRGDETSRARDRQQDDGDAEKYPGIERTDAVEHGTDELRRADAGGKAESESEGTHANLKRTDMSVCATKATQERRRNVCPVDEVT